MKNALAFATSIIIALSPFLGFSQSLDSTQQQPKKNSIAVEILSGPMWYSLNYQRVNFNYPLKKVSFTYKIGSSAIRNYQTVTAHAGVVIGKPSSSLEILLGAGYLRATPERPIWIDQKDLALNNLFVFPQISYRRQRDDKGLVGKVSLMPWIIVSPFVSSIRHTPGIGLSIGKVF
jgi:hypothetical protein